MFGHQRHVVEDTVWPLGNVQAVVSVMSQVCPVSSQRLSPRLADKICTMMFAGLSTDCAVQKSAVLQYIGVGAQHAHGARFVRKHPQFMVAHPEGVTRMRNARSCTQNNIAFYFERPAPYMLYYDLHNSVFVCLLFCAS